MSIKEKSEDLYPDKKVVLARGNTCLSCGRVKRESFEAGANYVLEMFVDIVNKNTKPNGMEDRAEMASDMLILIEQLNKFK